MDPITAIEAIPGIGPYMPYVALAISVASFLAMVLPPPAPTAGAAYMALYNAVHWVALNKGNAKAASVPVAPVVQATKGT